MQITVNLFHGETLTLRGTRRRVTRQRILLNYRKRLVRRECRTYSDIFHWLDHPKWWHK